MLSHRNVPTCRLIWSPQKVSEGPIDSGATYFLERKFADKHVVVWAQRSSTDDPEKNYVYVTISVPDVPKEKLKLDVKPTGLSFTGASSSKHTTYHVDMDLFAEIDPDNTKINHTDANIQLILRKKEMKEEYWPRLLKDSKKAHYLRTDFDKVSADTELFVF